MTNTQTADAVPAESLNPIAGPRLRGVLGRPDMVAVGDIVWLASELMFLAALFAAYFTIRNVTNAAAVPGAQSLWPGSRVTRWSTISSTVPATPPHVRALGWLG